MHFISLGSSKHKLMSQSQREEYRQRFPHEVPEICRGMMHGVKNDTNSFSYLYCTTLKVQGETKSAPLGQRLTHWNQEKRPDQLDAKDELLSSYILNNKVS